MVSGTITLMPVSRVGSVIETSEFTDFNVDDVGSDESFIELVIVVEESSWSSSISAALEVVVFMSSSGIGSSSSTVIWLSRLTDSISDIC